MKKLLVACASVLTAYIRCVELHNVCFWAGIGLKIEGEFNATTNFK